jgi:hypothetical protein
MNTQVERVILHELDNALLCDVCKRDHFVFYRDESVLNHGSIINPECPGCHEAITSIDEVHFLAWCERYHPELATKYQGAA